MSTRNKNRQKSRKKIHAAKLPRNGCLDTLRGFAIVLMIVDHTALLFFDATISMPSISDASTNPTLPIRFVTRLSMPLFCVLMGYFLAGQKETNWQRVVQVALAALAINVVFFTLYQNVEVLASLLVCLLVFSLIGNWFSLLLLAFLIFPFDLSVPWFNYPLSVVAACVAQGILLRNYGARIGVLASLLLLLGYFFVNPPTLYVLYFAPVATALVALGISYPKIQLTWLAFLGRYPLTAYLSQYFVLLTLSH